MTCFVRKNPFIMLAFMGFLYGQTPEAKELSAQQSFQKVKRVFIPNTADPNTGKRLVKDDEVAAFIQTGMGRVLFTPQGAFSATSVADTTGSLGPDAFGKSDVPTGKTVVFQMGFSQDRAAKRNLKPRLAEASGATTSFFKGPQSEWRTGIETYQKLVYDQVWDGISVEYQGFTDRLAMRIVVEPYADPSTAQIETGADVTVTEDGLLRATASGAALRGHIPHAYQFIDGQKIVRNAGYQGRNKQAFGFTVHAVDSAYPLYIEPSLTWGTFIGGKGGDGTERCTAVVVDAAGNTYVTGMSAAADFPTTAGAYSREWFGVYDVFVTKLIPTGTAVAYSTFLGGGTATDESVAIDLVGNGDVVVLGNTDSHDFPTTAGAFNETYNGDQDGFVVRLNSTGRDLVYATFLGGSNREIMEDLAVDTAGNAYVTGRSNSGNYPTTNGAFNETHQTADEVVITKLNPTGSGLVYSTFINGNSAESGDAVTIDDSGHAYVSGFTFSSDFPVTEGAYDETYNGGGRADAFVLKINPAGSDLIYATLIGGRDSDSGEGIVVDDAGNATIVGETWSADFPATTGAFDETFNGNVDVFVAQFNATGGALNFSTLLGGEDWDTPIGIERDSQGRFVIAGVAHASAFPTTAGAYQEQSGGSQDCFIAKLEASGRSLVFSTLIGGDGSDFAYGLALDREDNATIVGSTTSFDYPTTQGAFRPFINGSNDAMVTRLNSSGNALVFSTYIGGSPGDVGSSIAVDPAGDAYVIGSTYSASFPTTTGVFDRVLGGERDVFISKLDGDGSTLLYSAFLGGASIEIPGEVAVDASGHAYVTGYTRSFDYPTTPGAYDTTANLSGDAFVTKINPTGTELTYSTLVGGRSSDNGADIAVDARGNAFVTGWTNSEDFPTTNGVIDPSHNGSGDVFLLKLNSRGSALIYSTFLGGSSFDLARGLAVDATGHVYLTGETDSDSFPTTQGALDLRVDGGRDIFISKINPRATAAIYTTVLGTSQNESAKDIAVDSAGNAYVTGETRDPHFPTTPGAFSETFTTNDGNAVFLTKLNPSGSALVYSTFLGGNRYEYGTAVAVDADQQALVVGYTSSPNFPTTVNGFETTFNGWEDGFLVRLNTAGSVLNYGTFIGGMGRDQCADVALDGDGQAIIAGRTSSALFPTTSGAYDETPNGAGDAFVAKLCINFPAQPDAVTGPSTVCPSATGLIYSVPPVPDATGYRWSLPTGAVITAGEGTHRIVITFGTEAGTVSVAAENECGAGFAQTLAVSLENTPERPRFIRGQSRVCRGDTGVVYETDPVAGAESYLWEVPEDAVITAGQGTRTITVTFGNSGNSVSVAALNACTAGPVRLLNVAVQGVQILSAPDDTGVCPGENVHWVIETARAEVTGYQWFKDDVLLEGETTEALSLNAVSRADEGAYACRITDFCGTLFTDPVTLAVSAVTSVEATPGSQSLGLEPPIFDARFGCEVVDPEVSWLTFPSTPVVTDGTTVTLNPPPAVTTRLELSARDQTTGFVATAQAWLLVSANDGFDDLNSDGCNNVADMWELTPYWGEAFSGDPNDDGVIDVRDFLYIQVSEETPCR